MMEPKNLAIVVACAALLAACSGSDDSPAAVAHPLYAQSNETNNAVLQFERNADGTFAPRARIATGGRGTNGVDHVNKGVTGPDSLSSNRSVVVSGKRLFVANAGDNTVSVFQIDTATGTPRLLKASPTGGTLPTSLAVNNDVLYVSHQQGGTVGAYKIGIDGALTRIGFYTLSHPDAVLTQVEVSAGGKSLVVNEFLSELATRAPGKTLTTFPIKSDGTLGVPATMQSSGAGTLGGRFAHGKLSNVYVTAEAVSGSLSTYALDNGTLVAKSGPVIAVGQTEPCWLVITPDNRFVYTGNGAGTVSLYALDPEGRATLVTPVAATEPPPAGVASALAADAWISPDGKFLYQDYLGADKIVAYAIQPDGKLVKIGEQAANTASHVSLQGLDGI